MRHFLLVLLVLFSYSVSAQFGLTGSWNQNSAPNWDITRLSDEVVTAMPGDGLGIGLDYWFRLRNYRVEFTPELNYQENRVTVPNNIEQTTRWYSFFFNVNIYPFDFESDCECPVFSKQGSNLGKGFFLRVSPGLSLPDYSTTFTDPNGQDTHRTGDPVFSIGGGMGYDIGFSDFFTLSPIAGIRYFPDIEYQAYFPIEVPTDGSNHEIENINSSLTQLWAGVRLGVRF